MKTQFSILFLLVAFGSLQAQVYDFPTLISNIQTEIWSDDDGSGAAWVNQQNTDGSWSDLNYTPKTNVLNNKNHMVRLYEIAQTCTDSRNEHYNKTEYVTALKNGLQYWYDHIADDSNWWYNEIYYPQKLGEVMLMMRNLEDPLPLTSNAILSEEDLITLFTPKGKTNILSHGTGANAVDIAVHYMYRGVLTEDTVVLESISEVLEPTLTENIRSDLSYQDHGPQLQISSYGYVFCQNLIKLAKLLANTPAAFDNHSGNFSTVLSFIRNVQIPSIRGQYWDYSVLGRSISRTNNTKAGLGYLKELAYQIDTINADYYLDALDRFNGNASPNYNINEFHQHYWASDYTQHIRSDYSFNVRCVSSRTVESEEGNGENLKANYLSYGANFISVDGGEYYNIMPVWDWSMIPGTTVGYTTSFTNRSDWGTNYGNTSFVGGVSDGTYGASVLNQNNDGVTAKKSWFFFDNEVVCLGANITGSNVRTTINQCLFDGPVSYVNVGSDEIHSQSVSSSEFSTTELDWIRHGKVAYYFPAVSNVKFSIKSQKGSWYDINKNGSTEELSKYVYKMWIDHGTSTADDYAYIVAPNIVNDEEAMAFDVSALEIIQNNADIQAVYHKELDLLQVVFHTASSISFDNKSLTVNQPCAILLHESELTIADPMQLQSIIKVDLTVDDQVYTEYTTMPTGEDKGASIAVRFRLPAAVNQNACLSAISIYPNPASKELNFKLNDANNGYYDIFNCNGQKVLQGPCKKQETISINHLPQGMYFINVSTSEHRFDSLMFIKQ